MLLCHYSAVDKTEGAVLFAQDLNCFAEVRAGGREADDLVSTSRVIRYGNLRGGHCVQGGSTGGGHGGGCGVTTVKV